MANTSDKIVYEQQSFESKLTSAYRKDFGVFLTNNLQTIDEILSVIDFDGNLLTKRILEPSCGQGVFLVRILEKLFEKECSNSGIAEFINCNLIFVDLDARMVEATKKNLKEVYLNLAGKPYTGEFNGFVYDFTKKLKEETSDLTSSSEEHPLKKFYDQIDYVVGNPPYVSLYGRRDRKRNEQQRIDILNTYTQFPESVQNGKINYVMLFLEHSLDFLKPFGKLSFIIDVAFFETAYRHTRKYLLDNTVIHAIVYDLQEFDAASGQMILKLAKAKNLQNNKVAIKNAADHTIIRVNQNSWFDPEDEFKFRFSRCDESSSIIDKIFQKNLPTLKSLYPKKNLRTCVMLLNMEDRFVFEKIQRDDIKVYPYYQGSKGLKEKFGALNFKKYFHYDKPLQDAINDELKKELTKKGIKNKKRLGLGEAIIYDHPKVFIRQSAKEIIAAYDEKPSASNNSLYVFSLRDNTGESKTFLKFLCGFLNTDLITFFAQQRAIIRFSKGKQPQIKTSDLYQIPIPVELELQEKIAALVGRIYESDSTAIDKIKAEIDHLVFAYFDLSTEEINTIKRSIASFLLLFSDMQHPELGYGLFQNLLLFGHF